MDTPDTIKKPVRVQAILQARVGSTRLKNKIFEPVGGRTILEWAVERLKRAERIERIIIATSTNPLDSQVQEFADKIKIPCYRGPEDDVLSRFIGAMEQFPAQVIVRATGDNPALDSAFTDLMIESHIESGADYTSVEGNVPPGTTAEVVSTTALCKADEESGGPPSREHVTPYIYTNPDRFRINHVRPPAYLDNRPYRLTVDTLADLELVRKLCERIEQAGGVFDAVSAVALLDKEPELMKINAHVQQKDWRATS